MSTSPLVLRTKPGIKRDGTKFEGDFYVDGQWVRFQRGLPRKVAGYKAVSNYLSEVSRGLKTYTENGFTFVHSGSAEYLERFTLDQNGNASAVTDRTPISLLYSDNNAWQFDVLYDSINLVPSNKIIAQVAPNNSTLYNTEDGQVFIGDLRALDRLEEIGIPEGFSATGGVCVLHPFLTIFGTDGSVGWSAPGNPYDLTGVGSGNARVASQKIVRGLPLRGGPGNAPAGLYWSTDAVVRASYVGGNQTFQFDTISSQSSILSPNSVIEYDGIYFWIGVDRFLMFNGVVRDVENTMNINYFFDGLNRSQSQKVFAWKVPRFGEIWWAYPRGDATECTHAIIYNVREQSWYDTELPNGGRSAGEFTTQFATPLLTGTAFYGVNLDPGIRTTEAGDIRTTEDGKIRITYLNNNYKLWQHETGVNEIDINIINPIQSYFETSDISNAVLQSRDKSLRCDLIEPDFVQSGDMTVQIVGRANARAAEVYSEAKVFPAIATTPEEQVVFFKEIRREMRFRFESNAVNGDYQMGQVLIHIGEADGTILGATL